MKALIVFLFSFNAFAVMQMDEHALILDSHVLEKQGKLALAMDRVKKVLVSEPDNYFLHMRLAHLNLENQDEMKATGYFMKAAEVKPKSIEPWLALAKLSLKTDDIKTKTFSGEVLKRAPYHRGAALMFVKAAVKLKSHSDGLDQTNEILMAFPNDPFFLEQKAYFLSNLARKSEAKQALTELLLINPDNDYARKFIEKEK